MCRPFRRKRRGASVVEFAVVAPLFFLLILGMVEFGRMIMVQQILTNASREGARRAVLEGTTNTEVVTAVKDYLDGASVDGDSSTVQITDANGASIPDLTTTSATAVMVRVDINYDSVTWLPVSRFLKGKQLQAATTMRRESSD